MYYSDLNQLFKELLETKKYKRKNFLKEQYKNNNKLTDEDCKKIILKLFYDDDFDKYISVEMYIIKQLINNNGIITNIKVIKNYSYCTIYQGIKRLEKDNIVNIINDKPIIVVLNGGKYCH